jgi:hypothetical protein
LHLGGSKDEQNVCGRLLKSFEFLFKISYEFLIFLNNILNEALSRESSLAILHFFSRIYSCSAR